MEVIGEALLAHAAGEGHLPIATRCLLRLDTGVVRIELPRDARPMQAVLAVLAAAAAATERHFGVRARSSWQLVSSLCAGRLLANPNCPYPGRGELTRSW